MFSTVKPIDPKSGHAIIIYTPHPADDTRIGTLELSCSLDWMILVPGERLLAQGSNGTQNGIEITVEDYHIEIGSYADCGHITAYAENTPEAIESLNKCIEELKAAEIEYRALHE